MKTVNHQVDFCVVGGGLAGMCAAIAAARNGVKVLLMHDRPVLGGNASSEIRMWICGSHFHENALETGIIEEIQLENLYRNTWPSYAVWDSVLYGIVKFQENLTLLLNCSCNSLEMDSGKIKSVTGWQGTSETFHTVTAELFADCSGDSILAPLSGAEFRVGHEGRGTFGESTAPETANLKTMGMSCLIQAREYPEPKPFIAPPWARKIDDDPEHPIPNHDLAGKQNFWWLELGGEMDTIHDTEAIRDELIKIAYGMWDHIKNRGDHGAENWALEWVGFLPGKRESRRYTGDYTLTQNDVTSRTEFSDVIAYGGWPLDLHDTRGFDSAKKLTIIQHGVKVNGIYGIPYRCLYSKNIPNLMFAGRNISCSRAAFGSTRVMATCAAVGQATGTAAAIAVRNSLSPRGVYEAKLRELQQALMDDDCYLPGLKREISPLSKEAELRASTGEAEALRNGLDRPIGDEENCWVCRNGDHAEYLLNNEKMISGVRIVFDSNINRYDHNMPALYPLDLPEFSPPPELVKEFVLELLGPNGKWQEFHTETSNYQRLKKIAVNRKKQGVRLKIKQSHGNETVKIFAFEVF
jgi:hypothetical protein